MKSVNLLGKREMSWIGTFPLVQLLAMWLVAFFARVLSTSFLPRHVGFIMDGNRTFAKRRHWETKEGHSAGFDAMASVLETCYKSGVKTATVFGLSLENFKRPQKELNSLMDLAKWKMEQVISNGELCEKYGVRIKVLGDMSYLRDDVVQVFKKTEEMTKNNKNAVLNVCWAYTSRHDMAMGIRNAAKENSPNLKLSTNDDPPLDLVVRTSGVRRLSDFLLWETTSGNCTIEMIDTLWPEFTAINMLWILFKWSYNNKNGYGKNNKIKNSIK